MDLASYPALYRSADMASQAAQKLYMRLLLAEYGLLFLAAVVSMSVFSGAAINICYLIIFLLLIVAMLIRGAVRPIQDWYRYRALAESVKTLTWRYMMRASPFDGGVPDTSHRIFSGAMRKLLGGNRDAISKFSANYVETDQITPGMICVQEMGLADRISFYKEFRIDDQSRWYAISAASNKVCARRWFVAAIFLYFSALTLAGLRIFVGGSLFWPIEPIIVAGSCILGWVQIRRYSELSAVYGVTSQEIGMIKIELHNLSDESQFSNFVNEAELAFSREHTSWLARVA